MHYAGAGKTTLLDVLARRKNVGTTEGDVLINNMQPDKTFHRCAYTYLYIHTALEPYCAMY